MARVYELLLSAAVALDAYSEESRGYSAMTPDADQLIAIVPGCEQSPA